MATTESVICSSASGGGVAVRGGIGRRKRWGASGEGEVVQGGEDQGGVPLACRRRLDGGQRFVGLTQGDGDALVQRRCFGSVDLTEVSVHLSECACPTHGYGGSCGRPWHPDDPNGGPRDPAHAVRTALTRRFAARGAFRPNQAGPSSRSRIIVQAFGRSAWALPNHRQHRGGV
jgi:hypothetical protein